MAKLKLGAVLDDKPVKLNLEVSAAVYRDLVRYAEVLSQETGQKAIDPARLIEPMLVRFMATDRAFKRLKNDDSGTSGAK